MLGINGMKKAIFLLVCLLFLMSCLYAADTGVISFKLMLNKTVEIDVLPYFTDLEAKTITSYALDAKKTIREPQVRLGITTNETSTYNLKLSFSVMIETTDNSRWGRYIARVFNSEGTVVGTVELDDANPKSITFAGVTSSNASTLIDGYFPISFDLAKYLGDYSQGNYAGTITVEVNPE